jgi:transketolase
MSQSAKIVSEQSAAVSERDMANTIRALSMDAVQYANSGHPGMPMGMADAATALFTRFLKFDASRPDWSDRDRFVLSAGHGSMLLYSLLYLTGYPGVDIESLKNFRKLGSNTPGHPEFGHTAGIETTTGPLGQGFGAAVGMALAERLLNARHGDTIVDHYTYTICGDGCLMEGISQEAISLAGHLRLGKFIALWDDNNISIDGPLEMTCSDNQLERFAASGWDTIRVDGHDPEAIAVAIKAARETDQPSLIACRTVIGFGAPNKQGTAATHGAPLGDDEIAATRKEIGWPHQPFEVPGQLLAAWRAAGSRGAQARMAWEYRVSKLDEGTRARLTEPIDEEVEHAISQSVREAKKELCAKRKSLATRVSSQMLLEQLVPKVPGMIGGSADLTGSVGTHTSHHTPVKPGDFSGTYVHYGVREHGMAAAMNGLALHGGIVPYGGTFLVFTDYCRPSIRLSALMEQRVIYVMTHDSIGLGEDGPTHQPVEHLASLRAIPNLNVFRPADAVECVECWEIALTSPSAPSILSLTRQGLPLLRMNHTDKNFSSRGAYLIREAAGNRDLTLIATGSEVEIALKAASALTEEDFNVAVVSMPCWELFEAQPAAYQDRVLGSAPRVAIEAACAMGWHKWLGDGAFIGMSGFGASAAAAELYEHFGITADRIADAARALVCRRQGGSRS